MFAELRALTPKQRSAFLASFLGWTLDAFDFFLLTFVIPDIAREFSVAVADVAEALFLTLAMRPVGAFVFGLLAERFGRRPILMLDILLYSALELATAFSTSLEMLLVFRALFGLAMGGEWGLGASLAFETVPPKARGIVSGILQEGYAVGNLLAAIVFVALFNTIGWRGMFVVGVLPAFLVVYLRLHVEESPVWVATRANREKFLQSIWQSIRGRWGLFFYVVVLMACFNSLSHGSQDLFPTYLRLQHHLDTQATSVITAVGNFGAITGGVLFGILSERIGRKRGIILAALLTLVTIYPWAFGATPVVVAVGAFLVQLAVQGAWGIVPAHLNELAPEGTRGTFPGFTYQLGNLLASRNQVLQAKLADPARAVFGLPGSSYGFALALVTGISALLLIVITWFGPERKGIAFAGQEGEPADPERQLGPAEPLNAAR
ncbi:MAG TPA: MFS transporter [Alphaproteobacteria bacterium]|nr:MFS transporter [Alphaproteobacteria bacterium]